MGFRDLDMSENAKLFDDLSDKWWDLKGPFKLLHEFNTPRLKYIKEGLNIHFKASELEKIDILDIGCGGGLVSEDLAKNAIGKITAIDETKETIINAKKHAEKNNLNINYLNYSLDNFIKNNSQKFDVILALEVVEHVERIEDFITNIASLCKENTVIILSTINRTPKALLLAKFIAEYILKWLPMGIHDYNKFVKPAELEELFAQKNIFLKKLQGIKYNLISKKWFLDKDVAVNYMITFIKK